MTHTVLRIAAIVFVDHCSVGTLVALAARALQGPLPWRRRLATTSIVVVAWPLVLYGFLTPPNGDL